MDYCPNTCQQANNRCVESQGAEYKGWVGLWAVPVLGCSGGGKKQCVGWRPRVQSGSG